MLRTMSNGLLVGDDSHHSNRKSVPWEQLGGDPCSAFLQHGVGRATQLAPIEQRGESIRIHVPDVMKLSDAFAHAFPGH